MRILSGDRDMWQLLQEGSDLRILTFGGAPPVAAASARGRDAPYQTVDAAFVNTKLGVPPSQACGMRSRRCAAVIFGSICSEVHVLISTMPLHMSLPKHARANCLHA